MWFWLKKLLSALIMPLPLALLLIVWGLTRSSTAPTRRRWVWFGLTLLYVASCPPTAWLVLTPLESGQKGYVPVAERPVAAIAVLGAGYHPAPDRPLTGVLSGAAVTRVAEGVRIARSHPTAPLHCSGWGERWRGSNAEAACQLAVSLGVSATRTVLHPHARDTIEEADAVAAKTHGPVVLVTHAAHMARARAAFEARGVEVIPAPTGHVSTASPRWSLIPSVEALGTTSGALREWLGRAWLALRDGVMPPTTSRP